MKIEVLFSEVCNLYGDGMNMTYLRDSVPGAELHLTELGSRPLFADDGADVIYLGPMPEYAQELAVKALLPYRDALLRRIDEGRVFLITGNALEIFGKSIICDDGAEIPCLGVFDTIAYRTMLNRYAGLYLGSFEGQPVVGFKAQFGHSTGGEGEGLFDPVKGVGLDGTDGKPEGLRRNNFLATYLIGPVLPLNPPFTAWIMKTLGVADPKPAFLETAQAAYELRVKEFSDPRVHV